MIERSGLLRIPANNAATAWDATKLLPISIEALRRKYVKSDLEAAKILIMASAEESYSKILSSSVPETHANIMHALASPEVAIKGLLNELNGDKRSLDENSTIIKQHFQSIISAHGWTDVDLQTKSFLHFTACLLLLHEINATREQLHRVMDAPAAASDNTPLELAVSTLGNGTLTGGFFPDIAPATAIMSEGGLTDLSALLVPEPALPQIVPVTDNETPNPLLTAPQSIPTLRRSNRGHRVALGIALAGGLATSLFALQNRDQATITEPKVSPIPRRPIASSPPQNPPPPKPVVSNQQQPRIQYIEGSGRFLDASNPDRALFEIGIATALNSHRAEIRHCLSTDTDVRYLTTGLTRMISDELERLDWHVGDPRLETGVTVRWIDGDCQHFHITKWQVLNRERHIIAATEIALSRRPDDIARLRALLHPIRSNQ